MLEILICKPPPMRTQENVLAESAMMIPDTRGRLETVYEDLQRFVVSEVILTGVYLICG